MASFADTKYPVTPAVRVLRDAGVAFSPHVYDYVEKGGTAHSAKVMGVDEHAVIKTLVLQTDAKTPLPVLSWQKRPYFWWYLHCE